MSAAGAAGTIERVGYTSSITRVTGRGYRDYSDQRATRGAVRLALSRLRTARVRASRSRRGCRTSRAPRAPARSRRRSSTRIPAWPIRFSVRKHAGKTVRQGDLVAHARPRAGRAARARRGGVRQRAHPRQPAHLRHGGRRPLERRRVAAPERRRHARRARRCGSPPAPTCSGSTTTGWSRRTASTPSAATRHLPRRRLAARRAAQGPARARDERRALRARASSRSRRRLLASAGVRADAVRFQVSDRLVTATNPDDSGDRTLHAVSPRAGLVWRAAPLASAYATVSTSFETPTTTELGNKPDGSAGINPDLQPQRTVAVELGTKGLLPTLGVRWDVALFEARARDELVPFDIPGGAGRRYFRNAGRTLRRGGEVGVQADVGAAHDAGRVHVLALPLRGLHGGHHVVRGPPHSRACPSTRSPPPLALRHGSATLAVHGRRRQRDGRGRRQQRAGAGANDRRAGACPTRWSSAAVRVAPLVAHPEPRRGALRRVGERERHRGQVLRAGAGPHAARASRPRPRGVLTRVPTCRRPFRRRGGVSARRQ